MTTMTATNRVDKVRALLEENQLDAAIIAPGSDMAYVIGHFGHPSERPSVLIIRPDGRPQMVMAYFESLALPDIAADVDVATYTETVDPYDVLADVSRAYSDGLGRIAVSDQIWGSVLLRLQSSFSGARFEPASGYLKELRMRKDAGEVEKLRSAGQRADRALETVLRAPMAGHTEIEIANRLGRAMQDEGLTAPSAIVASGANGASPHHLSGTRTLASGDAVVIDFGGAYEGYQADMTRTVFVEDVDPADRSVYEIVRRAQEAGVRAARAGVSCQEVDTAARDVISDAGYGECFLHRTGHGIGLDGHEHPYIVQGNTLPLEAGMSHSVEPGIYLDGRMGVRIEDIVVVSESGGERLNHVTHELQIVS